MAHGVCLLRGSGAGSFDHDACERSVDRDDFVDQMCREKRDRICIWGKLCHAGKRVVLNIGEVSLFSGSGGRRLSLSLQMIFT